MKVLFLLTLFLSPMAIAKQDFKRIEYKQTLKDHVRGMARRIGIDKKLLHGIIKTESNGKLDAVNWKDGGSPSFGLGQIKLNTAKQLGFKGSWLRLMDPKVNLYWTARYIKWQLDRYDGNVRKAISAYNLGTANTKKNSKYISKVMLASSTF